MRFRKHTALLLLAALCLALLPLPAAAEAGPVFWLWPLDEPYDYDAISSTYGARFGRTHEGVDIAAPTGTPVHCARSGVVTSSRLSPSYGNVIEIDHGGGTSTLYAHLSKRSVKAGDEVTMGDVIGLVGSTGRSEASHLHFEIQKGGVAVNPTPVSVDPDKVHGNSAVTQKPRTYEYVFLSELSGTAPSGCAMLPPAEEGGFLAVSWTPSLRATAYLLSYTDPNGVLYALKTASTSACLPLLLAGSYEDILVVPVNEATGETAAARNALSYDCDAPCAPADPAGDGDAPLSDDGYSLLAGVGASPDGTVTVSYAGLAPANASLLVAFFDAEQNLLRLSRYAQSGAFHGQLVFRGLSLAASARVFLADSALTPLACSLTVSWTLPTPGA